MQQKTLSKLKPGGLRLWGTLPNLTSLRRPLSFKLLKEACDRMVLTCNSQNLLTVSDFRRDNALVKKTICKRTGRVTVAAWIEGLVGTQRNIMRRSRLDAVTASESRLRTPLRLAMQSQHWWGNGSCQQMRTRGGSNAWDLTEKLLMDHMTVVVLK